MPTSSTEGGSTSTDRDLATEGVSTSTDRDLEKGGVPISLAEGGVAAEAFSNDSHEHNDKESWCRICQMNSSTTDVLIDLGCLCKLDLSRAHKKCAETWFSGKGDRLCEICSKMAKNVHIARFTGSMVDSNIVDLPSTDGTDIESPEFQRDWQNGLCSILCIGRKMREVAKALKPCIISFILLGLLLIMYKA